MKNPMKIEFDDDIIDICYYIMNNTNKIPKIASNMFSCIPKIIDKTQMISKDLFRLINLYILLDKDGVVLFGNSKKQKYVSYNFIMYLILF